MNIEGASEVYIGKKLIGAVSIIATDREHIYVETTILLTIRGIQYRVNAHLNLYEDKKFHVSKDYNSGLYISRVPYTHRWIPSLSLKRTIALALEETVSKWVEKHRGILYNAETKYLTNAIEKRNEELDKMEKRKILLLDEIDKLIRGEHLPMYPEPYAKHR